MEEAGQPAPEYRQNEFMVYATIRHHRDSVNVENGTLNGTLNDTLNDRLNGRLNPTQQKVYDSIVGNPGIKAKDSPFVISSGFEPSNRNGEFRTVEFDTFAKC